MKSSASELGLSLIDIKPLLPKDDQYRSRATMKWETACHTLFALRDFVACAILNRFNRDEERRKDVWLTPKL